MLGMHTIDGGFHIKAAILDMGPKYFVSKTNANFPQNKIRNGLPTIQGVMAVFDAENGRLLALMDSIEVTIVRTGAATAVAAKYLSNQDANTVTIIGCGNQGRISLKALMAVREIQRAFVYDIEESVASAFASEMHNELRLDIEPVVNFRDALAVSEICVTCTPSKKYFIDKNFVKPGTFIAAVGADSEEKQEIDPRLLVNNKIVVDSVEQASKIGELHHALEAGIIHLKDVHAELGEVIAGLKKGRTSNDDIIIFDSTGTALQDAVAAAIVCEKAMKNSRSNIFAFTE